MIGRMTMNPSQIPYSCEFFTLHQMTISKTAKRAKQAKSANVSTRANPTSGLASQRRTRKPALIDPYGVTMLPRNFPRFADQVSMRMRTSVALTNSAGTAGTAQYLIYLNPRASATGDLYFSLGDYFNAIDAMSLQFSRFMISHYRIEATPTTAATAGGFIAINYEPTNASIAAPPSTVADVLTSNHADVAQVTQVAEVTVKPTDYFNTWLYTRSQAAGDQYDIAGVSQILGINSNAVSTDVGLLTLEFDIHFAGLRK